MTAAEKGPHLRSRLESILNVARGNASGFFSPAASLVDRFEQPGENARFLLSTRSPRKTWETCLKFAERQAPYLLGYSSYLAGYEEWKYDGTICSNHVRHAAAETHIALPHVKN